MISKVLTPEGLEKLKAELRELKEVKLPDIIDKIEKAKEMGDLSENAEYHDAKDHQGMINARIIEIENILKTATVQETANTGTINMGTTFEVENEKGETREFTIVGYNEADPLTGRISNESPLGQAFLGRKIGDMIEVDVPKGTINFKILNIR